MQVWRGELETPPQSSDLNPIKHPWEELECWLQARPFHSTSWSLILNSYTSKSCGKPTQKSGHCYSRKEGSNSRLTPVVLAQNAQQTHIGVTVRCPLTFGHILYLWPGSKPNHAYTCTTKTLNWSNLCDFVLPRRLRLLQCLSGVFGHQY